MECMETDREKLLKEVMAADFAAYDLGLYLNTHPCDQRALAIYRNVAQRARMLTDAYEKMYGPLTARSGANYMNWRWIESPWPWEKEV